MAVEQTSTISWYLRMFSYLLMICGLFGLAVGGVVIYGALADGAAAATGLPLSALVLGVAAAVANGITIAAGFSARGLAQPGRAAALRSLALAGVVALGVRVGAVLMPRAASFPRRSSSTCCSWRFASSSPATWGNRPNSSPAALADRGSNTVYCDPRAARCWPCCLRRNYD
ncbi:MAG: hypothetical protein ACLTDR_09385 [Adlercreutzia equolifaciens]